MPEKNILFISVTACLMFTAFMLTTTFTAIAAEEISPESQALALQNKYKALTSLTFAFDQVTRTGTRERRGHGEAVFYRYQHPSETTQKNNSPVQQSVMRWNYTEPDPQIIVSDGQTLSIYTEKNHQLIRTPARELESDITYAFFAGTRNLMDDFTAESTDLPYLFSSDKELQTLLLVPRQPHNQIRDVHVWFDSTGLIHHLMITDHFDSVTELSFDNIKADSLPPGDRKTLDEIITFPSPPGTEIISR
jgi:outer membrane lipoprotein carrier protein